MVYMKKGGCIKLCDAVTAEKLKRQGYTPFEVKAPQTGAQAAQNSTEDKPEGNTEDKPNKGKGKK